MNKPIAPAMSADVQSRHAMSPQDRTGQDRRRQERRATVDPLPLVPFAAKTRKPYETPTPDRLADLERATVADAELIHECRWRAEVARQRIANRRAEIERLRGWAA